jgi:hypothetical protein
MRRWIVMVFFAWSVSASDRSTLTENVAAQADPSQTYTLIVPASSEQTPRPLLLVFDPRGRGTHAASIFRAGAEQFGWLVLSSNGTRSDEEGEGNARAVVSAARRSFD